MTNPRNRHSLRRIFVGPIVVVLFVAVFGITGILLLTSSRAATSGASYEAENGTVSTPAQIIGDGSASNTHAVKFGTASSGGSGIKPDATNTGYPGGTQLAVVNGNLTVTTDGTTIDGKDIKGFLIIRASNVTVRNSLIEGGVATGNGAAIDIQSGTNILLDHITVQLAHPSVYLDGIWGDNFTGQYMNVSGGVDGMKVGDNTTISNSYIHDLSYFSSDPNQGGGPTHNDTIQILSGSNILIQSNNLVATDQDNSAIQVTQDYGAVSNLSLQGNWADGGGCTFNIAHSGGGAFTATAQNNRFGPNRGYSGCAILISTKVTLIGSGNVFDATNQPISVQQHD